METLFVLAATEAGTLRDVVGRVKEIPRVVEVQPVTGPFDLLVRVEAPAMREALDVVVDRIRRTPGIRSTETLISVGGGIMRSARIPGAAR